MKVVDGAAAPHAKAVHRATTSTADCFGGSGSGSSVPGTNRPRGYPFPGAVVGPSDYPFSGRRTAFVWFWLYPLPFRAGYPFPGAAVGPSDFPFPGQRTAFR